MASLLSTPLSSDFGKDFLWGVVTAAAQNEGAAFTDGRTASVWDAFAKRTGKIRGAAKPTTACDFYHRYKEDLLLVKALGFKVFRFSISWSRILPDGTGRVNKEALRFYNEVIDECLKLDIIPFVTLYHWDLPQVLEKEGGWVSYKILHWFARFANVCAEAFGDRVKHWIVLNEPMAFTSLGYMLGKHAPGKTGLKNFLPAVHHAVLAQADGGRILRSLVPQASIGTSFSCSEIVPYTDKTEDVLAAQRMDILMNRLFIEPALGKGYPRDDFKFLEQLEVQNKAWKYTKRMHFDFDFIGLQNYFPLTIKYHPLIPIIQAGEVKPAARKVPYTSMGWEVNAESFYRVIKRFWHYGSVKQIIVTENGAAYKDELKNSRVHDPRRIAYFEEHIAALYKARNSGINIAGYFAWTLMDNFEWAEGYRARFGLVHVDHTTQMRTIKDSGYWFRDFLAT
jgi:beta-glucosidase